MTGFLEPKYERYLKQMLRAHEGLELKAYKDSQGFWTIGIGHRLVEGTTPKDVWNAYVSGRSISKKRAEELFEQDYVKHAKEAAKYVPNFNNLPYNQKMAFIDMVFNMGGGKFKEFKKLNKAIAENDVAGMLREMQDSKWYNQVGDRSRNLIHLVQTGQMRKNNGRNLPMLPQVQAQAQALATKAAADTQPKPKVPGLMETFGPPRR